MSLSRYLLQKQPFVTKSFCYALSHDQLSHAYLLFGEHGTPLKETALFLAQTILCDHPNPLADEECIMCQRFVSNNYPDFIFLDGEEESIKKDEVRETLTLFQNTPLERKGIMVYVIHLVENMTVEAVNALLKFLEEPNDYTYAILTTQNEDKVLPTIISRCEKLRLVLTPRSEVLQEALSLGVSQEDAEILSCFYNSGEILKTVAAKDSYQKMKTSLVNGLDALSRAPNFGRYIFEKEITPLLGNKADALFFFDMLTQFFRDIVAKKAGNPISLGSYDTIIAEAAEKLPHVESSLLSIMTLRGEIGLNIRIGLILAHLVNILTKE
ncbi:MAG: DNA polymerase III subunit [Bacilli bacterium]|nr:DNA polymerase III subunit [Bacilli bacterium]